MSHGGATGARGGPPMHYTPPTNFSAISRNVYRSAYPTEANLPYLRHVGIETVVLLSIESLPAAVLQALAEVPGSGASQFTPLSPSTVKSATAANATRAPRGGEHTGASNGINTAASNHSSKEIRVIQLADMSSWRVDALSCSDDFSQQDVIRALDFTIDVRWQPVLLCCPTGELQTSVLVGCMRRYQGWSLTSILSECELFANLQPSLRMSLIGFIEAWRPEDYPISKTDIALRNREWARERASATWQLRRRHRRPLRHQQGHGLSHLHRGRRGVNATGSTGGGGLGCGDDGAGGLTAGSSVRRGSESTDLSSDDGSDACTDASAQSSSFTAAARSAGVAAAATAIEMTPEESAGIAGSGMRPPSAWRRRRPTCAGVREGAPFMAPGDSDDGATSVSAAYLDSVRSAGGGGGHLRETSPSAGGRLFEAHSVLPTCSDPCGSEVVYAAWFEEARRRNPRCCIDAVDGEFYSFSFADTLHGEGAENGAGLPLSTSRDQRATNFPKSLKEAEDARLPPPHVRYTAVRNPPVLDERSTYTKQSIVDEDDD